MGCTWVFERFNDSKYALYVGFLAQRNLYHKQNVLFYRTHRRLNIYTFETNSKTSRCNSFDDSFFPVINIWLSIKRIAAGPKIILETSSSLPGKMYYGP